MLTTECSMQDKVQKLLARHQVDSNDTVAGTTTNDQTAPEMSFAEPDDTNRSFTVVDIVERTKQQLRQMGIDMDQLNTPDRTLLKYVLFVLCSSSSICSSNIHCNLIITRLFIVAILRFQCM